MTTTSKPAAPSSTTIVFLHASLQFSDSPAQQEQDIRDLYALKPHVFTGTEAGPDKGQHNQNRALVGEYARLHGYRVTFWRSNFVAVNRGIIKPRSVDLGGVLIAESDETVGPGHDSGFAWLSFEHKDERVGRLSIAATHYPTPQDGRNEGVQLRMGRRLDAWAREAGEGVDLAFVAGDFNRNDERRDWFPENAVLLSAGDEAGKHPSTGHGPIDGHASSTRDGRVELKHTKVLSDRGFHQHSDHYPVVSSYRIKHLKAGA